MQYPASFVERLFRQFGGAKKVIKGLLTSGATKGAERAARERGSRRERSTTPDIAAGRHSMETSRTQPREPTPARASMDTYSSADSGRSLGGSAPSSSFDWCGRIVVYPW